MTFSLHNKDGFIMCSCPETMKTCCRFAWFRHPLCSLQTSCLSLHREFRIMNASKASAYIDELCSILCSDKFG